MTQTPLYLNLLLFCLGLYIIVRGSDLFLDSAVWIARASGVSQLVIGATIVSICTTLPEFVSSVTASLKGAVDMALGNAVGSIICNTGFILGGMLFFVVARAKREIFLVKGVFMVGLIGVALALVRPSLVDGVARLDRAEGCVLLIFLAVFLVVNYYESLHVEAPASEGNGEAPLPVARSEWSRHMGLFAGGGLLVAIGAYLLIEYGQRIASDLGVKEAVVSLVFVAFGTSLPELFTAISAVRKKAEDISVGNIFGANVLNIALVTGSSAVIRPLTLEDEWLFRLDIPVALCFCGFALLVGVGRGRLGRKSGVCLVTGYVLYLVSMVALKRIG
ncbi:MAG: sodium:calcium antiporter [Lentisphaerae bacterium]|jgi:cation:H+ antiporter|nr:sodium:calcium antiporter [Lentisphaerota bacterium]MBT4821377.1 sodium:calcium antiporter [Lentisphaerota bacterium]MBT5610343.1 sodium:calcium antiporter [Lentisphaerota bacterium]MBT7056171.1 sodium:calcium antiporter [Lentisphaerota bacterium]MBT7841907.1 sodium:calcium antiporter [Lentisphaerota bacterium]